VKLKYPRLTINVPNFITVIRILLTPLFVIFLQRDMFQMAILVFTIAGVSDGLDGFIARVFNQRTELGAYLDPIADKFLLIASFVTLGIQQHIPGWLAVIVISRDIVIVMGIAVLNIMDVKIRIHPTLISKVTTFVQLFTVFLTLLYPETPSEPMTKYVMFWVTAVLTTISGLHYMMLGLNTFQNGHDRLIR
jgi:cardiolipin synthase (CMP-forming)